MNEPTCTMELGEVFARQPFCQCIGGDRVGEEDGKAETLFVFSHGVDRERSGRHAGLKLRLDAQCLHYLTHTVCSVVDEHKGVVI